MDWYKHFTNSHDDPDISDAMDKMGDFGYSGFFILLDLYGQEFKHIDNDGFLKISKAFLQRKLRKRWTKVELLLNFFEKEISEPRFLWKDSMQYIYIKVPKFIELASNWSGRKIRKDLQRPYVAPTAKEVEVEEEEKKKRKKVIKKEVKILYGEHVRLTSVEYQKLIDKYGEAVTDKMITRMNLYAAQIGARAFSKKYISHYATLLNWADMKGIEPAPVKPSVENTEAKQQRIQRADTRKVMAHEYRELTARFHEKLAEWKHGSLNENSRSAFIDPLICVAVEPGKVTLWTEQDSADWVRDHYLEAISTEIGAEVIVTSEA